MLDLMYLRVHGKHDRGTAKEQYQYPEEDEAVYRNHRVVGELVPGADSTEPNEDGYVKQHIKGWLKGVIHGLEAEPVAVEVSQGTLGWQCETLWVSN